MRKPEKEEREVVSSLDLPIDSSDPSVCVKALMKITDEMMKVLDKDRMQGALCLMTAAAAIVDSECIGWSKEAGEEPDGHKVMRTYMQSTSVAWNSFLVMFKNLDPAEVGLEDFVNDSHRPKGETLQ